jgi:hypothetical protein
MAADGLRKAACRTFVGSADENTPGLVVVRGAVGVRTGPSLRTLRIVSPSLNYGEKVSPPVRTHTSRVSAGRRYLISVSSLNIGRYMLMITTPTMIPTPSIMIGSTIEVSDWIDASTSSS